MVNNIYAFHGADSKSGVTMLSQSTAQMLAARNPHMNILLIALSGRQNAEFIREESITIDRLKNRLDSGITIKKEEISQNPLLKNLFIVSGICDEVNERYYTPETALRLIEDLSVQFPIIIADTGSRLDSGLAIGGLNAASKKYCVLSQNEATIRRFERIRNLYKSMKIEFERFIINKYCAKDPYTLHYISKRLNIEHALFLLVSLSETARKAEREYKTLLEYKEQKYLRDIKKIVFAIEEDAGLTAPPEGKKFNAGILFRRASKKNKQR